MSLVPLPERSGIYLDDRVLDERLRSHQLVVRGVVDDVQNTGLARADLRAPGVVARLEAERAELFVAAARADLGDLLDADFGVGRRPAELELALLAVVEALAARGAALVAGVAADAHVCRLLSLSCDR